MRVELKSSISVWEETASLNENEKYSQKETIAHLLMKTFHQNGNCFHDIVLNSPHLIAKWVRYLGKKDWDENAKEIYSLMISRYPELPVEKIPVKHSLPVKSRFADTRLQILYKFTQGQAAIATFLNYMCGGKYILDENNAVYLLALAREQHVKGLAEKCLDFINTNLNRETFIPILEQSIRLGIPLEIPEEYGSFSSILKDIEICNDDFPYVSQLIHWIQLAKDYCPSSWDCRKWNLNTNYSTDYSHIEKILEKLPLIDASSKETIQVGIHVELADRSRLYKASLINLSSLSLSDHSKCDLLKDKQIAAFAKCFPNLLQLDLCMRQTTDNWLSLFSNECSKLQQLDLSYCEEVTDKGMIACSKNWVHLQKLDLFGCTGITNTGIQAIAESNPHLKELNLKRCGEKITEDGIAFIAKHSSELEVFKISGSTAAKGIVAIVQNCSKLREIDLSSPEITEVELSAIGRYCQHLQKLNLLGCDKITEEGIISFIQENPNPGALVELICPFITDKSLIAIAKTHPNLHTFLPLSNSNFTDTGLAAVAEGLPKLRKINVIGSEITNEGILSLEKNSELREISFCNCNKLTNEGIINFVKKCPKLESISLHDCEMIRSRDVLPAKVTIYKSDQR